MKAETVITAGRVSSLEADISPYMYLHKRFGESAQLKCSVFLSASKHDGGTNPRMVEQTRGAGSVFVRAAEEVWHLVNFSALGKT